MNRRSGGRRGRPARTICVDVIRGLYQEGYSFRAIARCTGIGYGTVRRAYHGLAPAGADPVASSVQTAGRKPVAPAARTSSGRARAAAFG
jgi:transposase